MTELYIALGIFLAAHVVPSYKPLRAGLVGRMGERLFMSLYGLFSLGLFIWLIAAYLAAPYQELWLVSTAMRHITLSVMFLVCLLLVCSFTQPNPFSLGGGGQGYDPENPGIVALSRHPAFWSFGLWSLAHLLVNGDLASLLFFGTMALLSLYGPKSLDEKRKAQLGAQDWQKLVDQTRRGLPEIGLKQWGLAIVLYVILFAAHEPVIGVMPYSF